MSWPASTHFGVGRDPRAHGKKGGKKGAAKLWAGKDRHSAEYKRGYQAGWRASERWFKACGFVLRRGRHSNQDEPTMGKGKALAAVDPVAANEQRP